MKKFYLSAVLAAVALSVNAQNLKIQSPNSQLPPLEISKANAPSILKAPSVKKAELQSNQRLIGYYTSDDADNYLGLGSYAQGDYEPAIQLGPSDYQAFEGSKVVGIRYAAGGGSITNGVAIYSEDADGNFNQIASKDTTISNEYYVWNTVFIPEDQQFAISASDYSALRVSYKVSPNQSSYPIAINSNAKGDLWINADFGYGYSWNNYGSTYGAPAIQLIVESDNFSDNAVTPEDFGSFTVATNGTRDVAVKFTNLGSSVSSIDYTTSINGETSAEQHIDLGNKALGVGGDFTETISFNAPSESGQYPVVVNVTKVNGEENEAPTSSANGTLIALSKVFKRGVVVEEFTGTGCGWCPRGLAGLKRLAETYPDNYVGVSIHQYNSNDPAYDADYHSFDWPGAPNSVINRNGVYIDPYYGSDYQGSTVDFAEALNDLPFLGVEVSGQWNADSTEVNATATIDPLVSGNYNIDFVLVADSVTGSEDAWNQSNYYSYYTPEQMGVANDPNIAQFTQGGEYGDAYIKWPFDDVLISSSYSGTTNKATLDELTSGTKATSTYTLSLPTKQPLASAINKKKVYVIAIVYDANGVANAAKSVIVAEDQATGIQSVSAADGTNYEIVARYNAAGQRISSPQPGLNILKYANGKTVKVILK